MMIASGDVQLRYKDVSILTPVLYLDVDKNMAWGSGNVQIKRGEDELFSDSFNFDLDQNKLKLGVINIIIHPPDAKEDLHLKASSIEDHEDHKTGFNGRLTGCSLDPPHYFISAESYEYYPDKRIIGHNVLLWNTIFFVPFPLWTPYYNYELGKRKIIWNFPAIGRKEAPGWGWFVQNTFDYDRIGDTDSSIYLDWFEFKGLGYGIRHQYEGWDHRGSLYYYQLEEGNTTPLKRNEKMSWQNQYKLTPESKIDWGFTKIDAERINVSGRQQTQSKHAQYLYDDLGDKYSFRIEESQDILFTHFGQSFSRTLNDQKHLDMSLNQDNRYVNNRQTLKGLVNHSLFFPNDIQLNNNLDLTRDGLIEKTPANQDDYTLKTYTTWTERLSDQAQLTVKVDQLFDLERDRVTGDSRSSLNDFFFKEPEITLNYSQPQFGFFRWTSETTVARYREVRFDSQRNRVLSYPADDSLGIQPNTYIFKNQLDQSFGSLSVSAGYHQYVFKNPGYDLFSGDRMYLYFLRPSLSGGITPFINNQIQYDRTFVHDQSNTPFQQFNYVKNSKANRISDTMTFLLFDPSKYTWSHSTSYDFERKAWNPYSTNLRLQPAAGLLLAVDTGIQDLAKPRKDLLYLPLNWTADLSPTTNTSLKYRLSQDLNQGILLNSSVILNFLVGSDKDYLWEFQTQFSYNKSGVLRTLQFDRYELETINIVKHEHCRLFTISYNKLLEEFKFKITFNAFPNDSIGFKKNKELWKVEGILDDPTQERF